MFSIEDNNKASIQLQVRPDVLQFNIFMIQFGFRSCTDLNADNGFVQNSCNNQTNLIPFLVKYI